MENSWPATGTSAGCGSARASRPSGPSSRCWRCPCWRCRSWRRHRCRWACWGRPRDVPFLLFAVLAGVWVDRCRKRPPPGRANLAKGLLLGLVPLLRAPGLLGIEPAADDRLRRRRLHGADRGRLPVVRAAFSSTATTWSKPTAGSPPARRSPRSAVPGLGGLLVGAITAPLVIAARLGLVPVLRPDARTGPAAARPARRHGPHRDGSGPDRRRRRRDRPQPLPSRLRREAATYNVAWQRARTRILVLWAVGELGLTPQRWACCWPSAASGALLGALAHRRRRAAVRSRSRHVDLGRWSATSACCSFPLTPAANGRRTGSARRSLRPARARGDRHQRPHLRDPPGRHAATIDARPHQRGLPSPHVRVHPPRRPGRRAARTDPRPATGPHDLRLRPLPVVAVAVPLTGPPPPHAPRRRPTHRGAVRCS